MAATVDGLLSGLDQFGRPVHAFNGIASAREFRRHIGLFHSRHDELPVLTCPQIAGFQVSTEASRSQPASKS